MIAFFRSSFRALGRAVPVLVLAGCALAAALAPLPGIGAAAPTILVVGDSISSAYGLPSGQGWVDLLQRKLTNEGFAYRVVNASITGDTTAGGRSRIGAALQAHKPEIVIIELGGNDGLRGAALAPVRANLEFMVDAVQKAGARAVLVGMQLPPNYGASYVRQFAALFSDVAKARNAGYVPFILQGFGDRPELFQADRIHPTVQAQPLMVENVWPELSRFLTRVPTLGPTQGQSQSVRRP